MRIAIKDVAAEVYAHGRYLKSHFSPEDLREPGEEFVGSDCRLQVHEGSWYFHTGSSDYDQDHRGAWGAASTPRGCTRAQAREIAKDLIDQALDQLAEED